MPKKKKYIYKLLSPLEKFLWKNLPDILNGPRQSKAWLVDHGHRHARPKDLVKGERNNFAHIMFLHNFTKKAKRNK